MSEQAKVVFYSSGLRLSGVAYRPSGSAGGGARPGIVLCNGYTTVKELYLPPLATAMAEAGFVALTFDYRGFGESEGPPGRLIPMEQVEDARNAITFLETQPDVDRGRIGVFGTSFGGGIAIVAAAVDPRARAVVSNMPVCHGERWLRGMRPYWDWVEFLRRLEADRASRVLTGASELVDRAVIAPPDPAADRTHARQRPRPQLRLESGQAILEFTPEEFAERISPRPLLMVVAAEDTRVPPEVSLPAFERAREPKTLKILPGVEHHAVYELPTRSELLEIVVPWLKEHVADRRDRATP
jgi:cephalosporin-C deacetylase-like acetyl esterase